MSSGTLTIDGNSGGINVIAPSGIVATYGVSAATAAITTNILIGSAGNIRNGGTGVDINNSPNSSTIAHFDNNTLNLGIKTTSPATALDVNGDATVRGQEIITGSATVQGGGFSVGGSSFSILGGSATVAYGMVVGGAFSQSGASATITNTSSITASAFFGDGSHLSNVASNYNCVLSSRGAGGSFQSGTNTTYTTITGSSVTITNVASNINTIKVIFPLVAYTLAGPNSCLYAQNDDGTLVENGTGNGLAVRYSGAGNTGFAWTYYTSAKSAGAHTYSLYWKTDSSGGGCSLFGAWSMIVCEGNVP